MDQLDQSSDTHRAASRGGLPGADSDDRLWSAFAGAQETSEFCAAWLALQCRTIPSATAGLLLLQRDDATYAPAAIWPDARKDVSYLKKAAQTALMERRGVVQMNDPEAARDSAAVARVHVAYPIDIRERLYGVVVLDILSHTGVDLQGVLRQLHWGTGWLEGLFWRVQSEGEARKLGRTSSALELVTVAEEHSRFEVAAIAVANELATRLKCDRVTIGFQVRRQIRLKAMSHSAWFQPKSKLVRGLENAMEEAFDQNAAIAHPAIPLTQRRVAVAHLDFSKAWQVGAVASVVIKTKGQPVGVITLERKSDQPFEPETILQAELAATLVGPILGLKLKANDWLSGRLSDEAGRVVKAVFGPRHPAAKLATAALVIAGLFVAFARMEFRVSAKSVLEGSIQRAAVAPFDGYIAQAPVRAGDIVSEGQVLATLDDRDLLFEKTRWETEKSKSAQKHRDALAKHDRSNILVMAQEIEQADAQLNLVNAKLARTRITAPIDGAVISGDLSQMLGAPITQGKLLFEIAPLNAYRVVLQTDERDIGYVSVGQTGTLSLNGSAARALPFTVSKVTSVATADEGRNYFRVEASLADNDVPLRPGMEGIGKINAGQQPLAWIWTRTILERAQLFLWSWSP
jgi:multidrug resistance efflux pump